MSLAQYLPHKIFVRTIKPEVQVDGSMQLGVMLVCDDWDPRISVELQITTSVREHLLSYLGRLHDRVKATLDDLHKKGQLNGTSSSTDSNH